MRNGTTAERTSDCELVIKRMVSGPPRLVFEAWTKAELMRQWWTPKSLGMTMLSCELDVRVGGGYRLVFQFGEGEPMAFFGKYLEVVPPSRLVWTNDEQGEAAQSVTTVTFEASGGKTLLTMHERHPSKEALDAALASGVCEGTQETFQQLEELISGLVAA